ncbi:deoxyribodipyrimidine photo-lyase [Arhodomonas sp. KWT]|uniref:cryptochrome/photolyase family protein n=1 Tax=Arhodomonas sp. KWT TaxID=2679915 RepID=UPI0013D6E3A3|nr:deoxyribodipyrimidine photo-lyase [Arhodomonas sp. KWT]
MTPVIVWFRRDLRLADNPALSAAAEAGPVCPVYIHDPDADGDWRPGAASRWWRHHALASLDESLRGHGLRLVIRRGPALETLRALVRETGASAVHWNRLYDPAPVARDRTVKQALQADGIAVHSHKAALLHEPWTVKTGQGSDYRAFTPFWRAARRGGEPDAPLPVPELAAPTTLPTGEPLTTLGLLPRIRWDGGLAGRWRPGEAGARERLAHFTRHALGDYGRARDYPGEPGTSGLSPHLHHGGISPRQIWSAVRNADDGHGEAAEAFLAEIGWREFAHHVLFHHPDLPDAPLNPRFAAFPWRADPGDRLLRAWQAGRTGFPIVDAGMHELWATGWMHNRVRMIAGSLLVKNLRLPWQAGERWFWDTLVDADLASNSLGWQWVAGSGADAAPYFRIFNPVRQGERFDPEGDYVARWLPALAALPPRHRHAPWAAPEGVLRDAGVRLGRDYPRPVVDLKASREEALAAFERIKRG